MFPSKVISTMTPMEESFILVENGCGTSRCNLGRKRDGLLKILARFFGSPVHVTLKVLEVAQGNLHPIKL